MDAETIIYLLVVGVSIVYSLIFKDGGKKKAAPNPPVMNPGSLSGTTRNTSVPRQPKQQNKQKSKKSRPADKEQARRFETLAEQLERREREAVRNSFLNEDEGGRSTDDEEDSVKSSAMETLGKLTKDDLKRAVILDAIFKRPEY